MQECLAADAGRASYWVVATNRTTEHYVAWPERATLDEAMDDVRRVYEEIPVVEFQKLMKDDDVTFLVARAHPHTASEFVWEWRWKPGGPPPSVSVAA